MDGWMDGLMDGWIDGWMDGWMGIRLRCKFSLHKYVQISLHTFIIIMNAYCHMLVQFYVNIHNLRPIKMLLYSYCIYLHIYIIPFNCIRKNIT